MRVAYDVDTWYPVYSIKPQEDFQAKSIEVSYEKYRRWQKTIKDTQT